MGPPAAGGGFVGAAFRRAFRLRFVGEDVLPAEREALASRVPPVHSPPLQAFLAWRRSLLFVVALALVPVELLAAVETFSDTADTPPLLLAFGVMKLLVGLGFLVLVWVLLPRWVDWSRQRRILFWGWLVYFLLPFVLFLYPFRSLVEGEGTLVEKGQAILIGLIFSLEAILTLAPKAVSLMPGILRAATASKLLFPGGSAPGWLMVLAAPIYALLVYVVLLMPYQITGSGWFVGAMVGIIGAQVWLAANGLRIARPMTEPEARQAIGRARTGYMVFNVLGLLFAAVGFFELVSQLELRVLSIVNLLLAFVANVLVLTLVATDLLVVALARGRTAARTAAALDEAYGREVEAFVWEGSPPRAPPPGASA
jgi:hypothetical protein